MLASLVGGRVFLHNMSRVVLTVSAATSIRYALHRRQFGDQAGPGSPAVVRCTPPHVLRLLLRMRRSSRRVMTDMYATHEQTLPELHWRSAALKAHFT